MELRDLRIGDIVTTNGVPILTVKGEYYKIVGIDSKNTFEYFVGSVDIQSLKGRGFFDGHAWADSSEPIPITDALLLKLGFEKHDCSDLGLDIEYELATLKGFISVSNVSNSRGKEYSVQIDNLAHTSVGGMDIAYLHELQHFVWDCLKVELKIEL